MMTLLLLFLFNECKKKKTEGQKYCVYAKECNVNNTIKQQTTV